MKTTRGRTVSGAVYCASGASYIREAVRSARSLKRMHPELKIELFADVPVSDPIFDRCTVLPQGLPALAGKVHAVLNSSFDTCLFLDSDTLVVRTLQPFFDMLDEFDFVICNEPANVPGLATVVGPKYKNPEHFNTGVYLVRKTPAMVDFLERWLDIVAAANAEQVIVGTRFGDQAVFNRLLADEQQAGQLASWFGVADNLRFNARGGMFKEMKREKIYGQAAILHCHSIHAGILTRLGWSARAIFESPSRGSSATAALGGSGRSKPELAAVYAAVGELFIREAVRSARSLKRMHPELKIELFADMPVSDSVFDRCTVLPQGLPALAGKVHAVLNSSFDTCLFLDSDTLVVRTLRPFFDMLDEFDFVICNEPANVPGLATLVGPKYKNPEHFNTGVYLVRKTPAMVDFLERWKETMCAADPAKVVVAGEFNDQTVWNRMVLKESEDSALPAWLGVADNLIFNARGGMFREMRRDGLLKDAAILHCHSIHASLWQRSIWKLKSPFRSGKNAAGPDVVETAKVA